MKEEKKKKKSSKLNSNKKTPAKKNIEKKQENKVSNIVEEKEIVTIKQETKKEQKIKKKVSFKDWFNKITLEQIIVTGIIIIAILLITLIWVSTKNTKTKDGNDIVAKITGKTITADDLYKELKKSNGRNYIVNIIDDYILNKEYKTTDEMKESAKSTIENYRNTYKDNYESFLQYNGISNDSELKDLLIKNAKLTKAVEKYIKDNLTENEMKNYYNDYIVGDISAKHILISVAADATEEDKAKAKTKAEEVITKLKDGKNFDDLAKEYSDEESSKNNGGDLGYFNTGDMVEPFEIAAYGLKVDEYTTEPVETTYGYHVIMKTGEKKKPTYKKSKDAVIEKLVEQKKNNDTTLNVKTLISLRKKYKLNIKDKTIKSDYNSYIKDAVTTTTTTTVSTGN